MEKIIDKLIFLDVDGVINHTKWFNWAHKHPEFLKAGGHRNIDPDAVKKIIEICEQTDAWIVMSSSWRLWTLEGTFKNLNGIRDLRPILNRMCGITPRTEDRNRGQEIKYFLNSCRKNHFLSDFGHPLSDARFKITNFPKFVILDDDTDMLDEQLPFFIHVNDEVGITDEDVKKAVKILNRAD